MRRARKVIVIGLDGLEPTIVEAMLRSGELPHLARLQSLGGYARLRTTTPAQTPVAWSSFATGTNPGGHGVFDFLRRDPATYLPDLSLSRYEQRSAFLPPTAVNLRRGTPLWSPLSDHDVPSVVLRCPGTYPPDALKGVMLSGMGVPDIRGGLGTATLLTTDPEARAREGEQVLALRREGAVLHGAFVGPRKPRHGQDITAPFTLRVVPAGDGATLECEGEPARLALRQGVWSEWLRLRFRAGLLTGVRAVVRLLLLRTSPHVELYVSPGNFDPRAPLYPISHPDHYATELARALGDDVGGAFFTAGMVEDHGGLSNGRFSEELFLAQCEIALRERVAMMRHELGRLREGFFFILFDTPDRIQHMFWRFREATHPATRAIGEDPRRVAEMARVIEEHYVRCDAIVGEALEAADEQTLVLVASDHGFTSFQRGVHLNNWLHANGYLALRDGSVPRSDSPDFLREVDWGRTRAYALGLGSVYLNQRGRERDGIVAADEAERLAQEIALRLQGLRDPETGATAVDGAWTGRALYRGAYALESPDVVVGFARGYRVSWSTALGGFGDGLVEDNVRRWGGDHIVAPSLVPGVCFANRPLPDDLCMLDLAPTILSAFGVPTPATMEGRVVIDGDYRA